jgi:acyl carrier protein
MLSENEIKRIQNIVIEQLDVKREQLTPDARLTEDLGADSLDKVEIIMALEEEFGVTAPDKDVEGVESMQDLCEAVAAMLRR